MRVEATAAGFCETLWGKHPRIQILTIAELLGGKRPDMPLSMSERRSGRHRERGKKGINRNWLYEWSAKALISPNTEAEYRRGAEMPGSNGLNPTARKAALQRLYRSDVGCISWPYRVPN
jgi:hypothetical protein